MKSFFKALLLSIGIIAAFSCKENHPTIVLNSSNTVELKVGGISQIVYSVDPATAAVTWTSSDESVATVSGQYIVANAVGSAVITGTVDGGSSIAINVYVTALPVTSFDMDSSKSIYIGETTKISVSNVEPSTANAGSLIWSSDNEAVATVVGSKDSVVVTGLSAGTAIIKAEAAEAPDDSTPFSRTCTVVVKGPDTFCFEGGETSLTIFVTESQTVKVLQEPELYSEYKWESSNTSVATVTPSGNEATISAVAEGNSTVKVTAGPLSLSMDVTVKSAGIVLENCPTDYMLKDETVEVKATVKPSSLSGNFIWTSSNTSVMTVTGKSDGTAVIKAGATSGTATLVVKCGDLYATCGVNVIGSDYDPRICLTSDAPEFSSSQKRVGKYTNGSTVWYMPYGNSCLSNLELTDEYAVSNMTTYTDYISVCASDGTPLPTAVTSRVVWTCDTSDEFETSSNEKGTYCILGTKRPRKVVVSAACPGGITLTLNVNIIPAQIYLTAFSPVCDKADSNGRRYSSGAISTTQTTLYATGCREGLTPTQAMLPTSATSGEYVYYRFTGMCIRPDGKQSICVITSDLKMNNASSLPSAARFVNCGYAKEPNAAKYLSDMPVLIVGKISVPSDYVEINMNLGTSGRQYRGGQYVDTWQSGGIYTFKFLITPSTTLTSYSTDYLN